MSGNYNIGRQRRVLMIVANPAVSPVTQWPIGFWWSELSHPYFTFVEAGYAIQIASPEGGNLESDGYSDPEHESGYSRDDFVSRGFKNSPEHAAQLKNSPALAELNPADFDGLFVAGGQSPMVTMANNEEFHSFITDFYESGKPLALVCHATSVLLRAKLSNGDRLVNGKTWTGFSDAEEQFVEESLGGKVQPFWIETEARKIDGTNFITQSAFRPHAVRDGLLITGQQQASGAVTARLLIEAIGL